MHLFAPGHRGCAGCGPAIAMRMIVDTLGEDIIVVNSTGCMEIISSPYPESSWRVPYIHSLFENAPAVAAGIAKCFEVQGKKTKVVCICGDGASYDIGFGALSGMLERNDNVLFICYDNEAYMNCLSLDSLIMTEDGLKKISEVKVGDGVYAFDQKARKPVLKKCTGVFDNGTHDIFELETLHHSIKATSNHPFLVLKRNGKRGRNCFVWKTLSEIGAGDEIVVLKKLSEEKPFKFAFAETEIGDYKVTHLAEIELPEHTSPDLMEYLGLYVGDGWVRPEKGRGEVGFALPADTEGREKLMGIHAKIFGNSINCDDKEYVYIHSVNLARFIDSLGFGRGAKNKTIPPFVFMLPEAEREAFIEGLMLSDGYQIGNSMRYVSSSFELLRRLRLLVQITGYRVGKIHRQMKPKGAKCVYRKLLKDSEYGYICFSKKNGFEKRYSPQYKQRDFLIDNEWFSTEEVRGVRLAGKEPTLDLRVEGEHNFIADGIVVHNTGVQRSGATPFMANTTTSQAGRKVPGKQEWKKPLAEIAAAHRIPYAATASIGFWKDFEGKLKKAADIKGARVLVVLAPCPPGWGAASEQTVQLSKLAVETGIWRLFEIEDGRMTLSYKPKMAPLAEYFSLQKRFKHLGEQDIALISKKVADEWARHDEVAGCAAKIGELEKKLGELEKEKAAADEAKMKGLNEVIAKLKGELEEANRQCDRKIAERVGELEKKLAEMGGERDALRSKIDVYGKQVEADKQRVAELEQSSNRLSEEVQQAIAAYSAKMGGVGKAIGLAESEFQKLEASAKEDEKKLAEMAAAQQESRAMEHELGSIWEERKHLEERIEEHEGELKEDVRRIQALEAEMGKLLSELVLAKKMQ